MNDELYEVTSLKPKKKNYEIIIRDEEKKDKTFLVSEDIVVDFRLVKGKVLTKTKYKEFVNSANVDKIYQKVLYYATYKQRSVKDVWDYLNKKQILDSDKQYYIDKLKKVSILDDNSYAKNYVFEAFNYKLLGPKKIIRDLKLKDIDKEIYETYISSISHDEIIHNIETLFFKKLRELKNCSVRKAMMSLKTYIANKGYDFDDVEKVIKKHQDEIIKQSDEDKAIEKDFEIASNQYEKRKPKENKKSYIIKKLSAKGYSYSKIKSLLERN